MTTARRFTVIEGGADLVASFDSATRIGDVVGQLKRAAQAPRRGHRGSKVGGHALTAADIRAEQVAAWLVGLGEIADHGDGAKVSAAMALLLAAMDAETRAWAVARRQDSGGPALPAAGMGKTLGGDVLETRTATSARPSPSSGFPNFPGEGAAEGMPPSGPRSRPLIAGDREYQRLRFAAQAAFDELAGFTGCGVARLGVSLPERTRRELVDAAKDLSVACQEPRLGAVPGVARFCSALARGLATTVLRREAEQAAEACAALAAYVDAWTARRDGGGA